MDKNFIMYRYFYWALLFLSGCSLFYSSAKVEKKKPLYGYSSTPLDEDYFHSPTGDVAGHIPKGWLQVNTESIPELENVLAVYTNPDRSRAMVLTEIPGSADLRRKVERDGILALAEESFQAKLQKHTSLTITLQPEAFTIDSMLFVNYEYIQKLDSGGVLHNRVVAFSAGVRFYEIAIVELRPSSNPNQYLENFRILQSVIAGLEGVAAVRVGSTTH